MLTPRMQSPYTLTMNNRRSFLALLLTCVLASACGGESSDGPSEAAPGEAKAAGKAAREPRSKRANKDRGDASMVLAGTAWTADAAKASFRGDRLTIRASRMERVEDVMVRDELHLAIGEFKGPGAYTSTVSGSRFIRVGINTKSAAAAGSDDAKVSKEVAKALTAAKHLMLMGAKITITKVTDGQVSGTFSWSPPSGKGDAITAGSFRALIRK